MATQRDRLFIVGGVVTFFAFTITTCSLMSKPDPPMSTADSARGACLVFIQQRLDDPSSAEWEPSSSWSSLQEPGGDWSVVAHYRAKNGFGALRKSMTHCRMSLQGKEWRLVSITTL